MTDVDRTVRSAVAPLLGEARIASVLTSQLPAGTVVVVLEQQGPWLRVRCPDRYEGWLHSGYVIPTRGDEASWLVSLGCRTHDANRDQGRHGTHDGAHHVRSLPLGARFAPEVRVIDGEWFHPHAQQTRFPPTGAAIAQSAATLFESASYLWGGVTPWGCDCSGFVQTIFQLHGVPLPRDASQQALSGASVPLGGPYHAADLLFFSDRDDHRVTHVGLALGDGRMVHSALLRGGVAIEQLDDDSDPYVARLEQQRVSARRVVAT